jgi:hypothetical protein
VSSTHPPPLYTHSHQVSVLSSHTPPLFPHSHQVSVSSTHTPPHCTHSHEVSVSSTHPPPLCTHTHTHTHQDTVSSTHPRARPVTLTSAVDLSKTKSYSSIAIAAEALGVDERVVGELLCSHSQLSQQLSRSDYRYLTFFPSIAPVLLSRLVINMPMKGLGRVRLHTEVLNHAPFSSGAPLSRTNKQAKEPHSAIRYLSQQYHLITHGAVSQPHRFITHQQASERTKAGPAMGGSLRTQKR